MLLFIQAYINLIHVSKSVKEAPASGLLPEAHYINGLLAHISNGSEYRCIYIKIRWECVTTLHVPCLLSCHNMRKWCVTWFDRLNEYNIKKNLTWDLNDTDKNKHKTFLGNESTIETIHYACEHQPICWMFVVDKQRDNMNNNFIVLNIAITRPHMWEHVTQILGSLHSCTI